MARKELKNEKAKAKRDKIESDIDKAATIADLRKAIKKIWEYVK
ncbi:MAG: hypothetical protein ACLFQX_08205 [Candidatus Kapaibacterium sp.]